MGRPAQDRTAQILGAARACFEDAGPAATTIEGIAARAGVGKGTVFLYWPNKGRLLRAVAALDEARRTVSVREILRQTPGRLTIGWFVARNLPELQDVPYLRSLALNLQASLDQVNELAPDGVEFPLLGRDVVEVIHRHGLIRDATVAETVRGIELVVVGAAFRSLTCPDTGADTHADVEQVIDRAYGADVPETVRARAGDELLAVLDRHVDTLLRLAAPDRPTDTDLMTLALAPADT